MPVPGGNAENVCPQCVNIGPVEGYSDPPHEGKAPKQGATVRFRINGEYSTRAKSFLSQVGSRMHRRETSDWVPGDKLRHP